MKCVCQPPTAAMIFCIAISRLAAGPVTSFSDIEFWVGTGANQATLVLDWDGTSTDDHALAWGYRFDGTPKAFDMLHAIVAADARLYAKIGQFGGFGYGVFGMGYDANNDGQFALTDETFFDEQGFAITDPADGAVSVDPADFYGEGWIDGVWQYGVANGNPFAGGDWEWSGAGLSSRNVLADSWHSLAFSTNSSPQSFAQNPIAAEPSGNADFDADGDVDGHDFLIWQRGDSPNPLSKTDLALWSEQYGTNSNMLASLEQVSSRSPLQSQGMQPPGFFTRSIPEPSTGLLFLFVFLFPRIAYRDRRMIL